MTEDRLYCSRPILAASVAVIRDGSILLAARGKPPGEGLYSLPGCMVEAGETLAEAALRELREEVGVEAEIMGLLAHRAKKWTRFFAPNDALFPRRQHRICPKSANPLFTSDALAPVEFIERDGRGHIKHHVVIAAHAARWVSGEPQTGPEAKDIRWVTERDIADLPMTAGLGGILEQAFTIARGDARP